MKAVAVAGILSLLAVPAFASGPPNSRSFGYSAAEGGDRLWGFCGSTLEGPAPQFCWLYIEGVADGISLAAGTDSAGNGRASFCLPIGVKSDQMADVVRHYLFGHPEIRDRSASWLVLQALNDAFPCATPPGR